MPYGATCNIYCTSSSKNTKSIINYNSATSYSTEIQQIGLNLAEYIESSIEPIEMSFNYSKKNGILVEIITNLEVITNSNIRKDSDGHYSIINSSWLSSGDGNFTISNATWFNNGKQGTPYIYLCFNSVKIENCFISKAADNVENGFRSLTYDDSKIYPHYDSNLKATLARYTIISWNKTESNKLLYGEDDGMSQFHNRYYIYSYTNNQQSRLFYSDQHSTIIKGYTATIPRMDGGANIKQYIGPYFIGFVVNIGEVGEWKPGSQYYIKSGTYYSYDTDGYRISKTVTSKTAPVTTNNSIPLLYSIERYGSSNNSFYYTSGTNYSSKPYFSPANGLELESDWNLTCNSFNECPSFCSHCPSNCPTQGGDSSTSYTVLVINGPAGTGYGVTGWKISDHSQYWVPNGEYTNYSRYGTGTYKININGTEVGVQEYPGYNYVYEETRTSGSCGGGCTNYTCDDSPTCGCDYPFYCDDNPCYCNTNRVCAVYSSYCRSVCDVAQPC